MSAYPQRSKYFFIFLSLLLFCPIFLSSCGKISSLEKNTQEFYEFEKTAAKFNLGNSEKFIFSILTTTADGKGRLLIQYEKEDISSGNSKGKFLKLSNDRGKTFKEEIEIATLFTENQRFSIYNFKFIDKGIALLGAKDGNLFFSRSDENLKNWSKPAQINDDEGSLISGNQIEVLENGEAYCVWMDKRRGFELIYFSKSIDGGKTWSPNQPLEYDFREGNQEHPTLVKASERRLLVVWQDWRDRKTLSDIRASYSDDKGKNWQPSVKINDDDLDVWQMIPSVVAKGSNIYIAFSDFRDKGDTDDNDWNIYFVSSTDNGSSWNKNRRLNDIVVGRDSSPNLSIDKDGNLYCIWWSARQTLFGQVAFSYSNNNGETWSPSVLLTPNNQIQTENSFYLQHISEGLLLSRWVTSESGARKNKYSFVKKSSDRIASQTGSSKREVYEPLKFESGEVLFKDDFSGVNQKKWEPKEGIWSLVNGMYRGSNPDSLERRFVSYAKLIEPEKYIISGRFKLDSTAHMLASIYFRVSEDYQHHYVIKNQFRKGAWLSLKDDDSTTGQDSVGGKPLVQKRFSYRQGRWYKFRLLVTPKGLDYFVDEKLMLSYREPLALEEGRVGIGGFTFAPTYFDDISISEIKE